MRSSLLAILLLATMILPATALDLATRPVGPVMTWRGADLASHYSVSWLEVKFVEGSDIRIQDGAFTDDSGRDLSALGRVLASEAVIEMRPTFNHDRATLRAWKRLGEIRSGVTGPDLSLWFDIHVAGGTEAVARLVNALNDLPVVEIAHPVAIPEPAAMPQARPLEDQLLQPTPDFTGRQTYLGLPPVGLNATTAWGIPGGMGAGEHFMDVELCWTTDHEDFDTSKRFYIGGATQDPAYETHGTAVLGEVIGQHNGFGIDGFAPDVNYGVVAVTVAEWPVVPQYFQEAIDHLSTGDVWLIELQMYPAGRDATPMEWLQVNYDVIWTGVYARGIVCIEAGANGSQNLDDPSWNRIFDRTYRDSGAIMVAAGTPTGLVYEWFTNYGSRMDVHAWGSSITTTGYGDLYNGGTLQTRYTAQFSGTSGASPMATGSALILQGIARANLSAPLDPIVLRQILHDTGTPYNGARIIGPRPNLGPASEAVLAITGVREESGAIAGATAFPNPFRSKAEIRFASPSEAPVRVIIVDAAGRRVRTLTDARAIAGNRHFLWDGTDESGRALGSGVYFYRLDTERAGSPTGRLEIIR